MAKGILEFNLDDSFEENAFKRASRATEAWLALHDISEYIFRRRIKYGEYPDEQHEILQAMWDEFHELLDDHSINLNDLD